MATSKITNLSILDDAVRTAGIQDAAVTTAKTSGVPTLFRPNANPILINCNMEIAQRGTSATGIGQGDSGYHTIDRWRYDEGGSPSQEWTQTQETLTSGNAWADGFNYALKMDCTTADSSLASDIYEAITMYVEKQDLTLFKKGTSSAEKMTLAFWVKATKTGTNIVELQDQVNDRAISIAYTISSSNTWEKKVLNISADTTGAFGTGNAVGLKMRWYLDAGSEYQSSALQTSWASANTNKRATGQVNNADSTSNNWHLTGVQFEVGEYTSATIPPFQHESFADNLERCERYYQVVGSGTRADNLMYFYAYNFDGTSTMFGAYNFRKEMRASPSIDQTSGTNYYTFKCNNATDDFDGVNGFRGGIAGGEFYLSGGSSVGSSSAGQAGVVMGKDASSHVALVSEL